jgi:hypothetical protein
MHSEPRCDRGLYTSVPLGMRCIASCHFVSAFRIGAKMSVPQGFVRVSKHRRCPVCGKADWCLIAAESPPVRAVCQRVNSPIRFGDAGFLHAWGEAHRPDQRMIRLRIAVPAATTHDRFRTQMAEFHESVDAGELSAFACRLGVGLHSLQRLGIGRHRYAWAFPMSSPRGEIVGIRLRPDSGGKICVNGSRLGLFMPQGPLTSDEVMICEGESDAAAMLSLGFYAIGRPGLRQWDGLPQRTRDTGCIPPDRDHERFR